MTGPRNRENRSDVRDIAALLPPVAEFDALRRRIHNDFARAEDDRTRKRMESWLAGVSYAELRSLLSRLDDAEAERDRAVEALRRYVAASPWKNRPDDQLTDEQAELLAVLAAVPVEEEKP